MKRRRVLATGLLLCALTACSHHAAPTAAGAFVTPGPSASQSANLPSTGASTGATAASPGAASPTGGATTSGPTAPPKATPQPTPKATHAPGTATICSGGAINIGAVHRKWLLTQVTPVFSATAGGKYTVPPFTQVASVTASVTAGPQVPTIKVYTTFARTAGFNAGIRLYGEIYTGANSSVDTTSLASGKYVVYRSVHEVSATFTYRCGKGENGRPYEGFAKSVTSESAGVVNCGRSLPAGSDADAVAARATCKKHKS